MLQKPQRAVGRSLFSAAERLAEALLVRLTQAGIVGEYEGAGSDAETAAMLSREEWRAVVIITRDDVLALRLSLLSAHLRADLPVWTTFFEATLARA